MTGRTECSWKNQSGNSSGLSGCKMDWLVNSSGSSANSSDSSGYKTDSSVNISDSSVNSLDL